MTNDKDLAERCRAWRNHGQQIVDGRREFLLPGLNYRMTEMQAALGRVQLSKFPSILNRRGALVRQYFTDGFYPSGMATPGSGFTPSGALIRAVMLNSAVDMTGIAGFPSNQEGWGRTLLDNALYFETYSA